MDIGIVGNPTTGGPSNPGGALACPVCTLYLREGISLQRHLDTHPKEQVIEALIKASSQTQQLQSSMSIPSVTSSIQSLQNTPQQHIQQQQQTTAHVSAAQSPYPIGPIFECPPIGTMMPPQFASFSYQQFVNNGTMMIPQYAMAPQTNQMMQMLYNPYGMYQQQQIPTVQMISPVAAIPNTTRMRPVVSMSGETNTRTTITVPVNSSEPKQILPEILPEPEVENEHDLPDINFPASPEVSNNNTSIQQDGNDNNRIQLEHRTQQIQNNTIQDQNSVQHEYNSIPRSLTITCNIENEDDENAESVLPDIDERETTHMVASIVQCKSTHYEEQSETQRFDQEYKDDSSKLDVNPQGVLESALEIEEEKIEEDKSLTEEKEKSENESVPSQVPAIETIKDIVQPEVEQLEQLLINIMESEFNNSTTKEDDVVQQEEEEKGNSSIHTDEEIITPNIIDVTPSSQNNDDTDECHIEMEITEEPKICVEEKSDKNYILYHYKESLSAPPSPAVRKKSTRTYSVRSEYGSNEFLSVYPAGFDATTLQDEEEEEEEEKNVTEDNFDEADMEIEAIPSPHTPFTKYGESSDVVRSHTPLSAISGISVLRVRKDLSKPCSPASVHSFCHMDADSLSHDEESNDLGEITIEKDPISCPQIEEEVKVDKYEENVRENVEKKGDNSNHVYHQSVITEHVSLFPPIHSQQPVLIEDSYSLPNNKNHSLLNLSESINPTTSTESKNYHSNKSIIQKQSMELLNINEDAHAGPMNVFEFDGLQILVPSTFISESSQKAVSATSQQSMASSEGGAGIDEEVKSVNMRADETMPPRGELSEQESNGCTEQSAWQVYEVARFNKEVVWLYLIKVFVLKKRIMANATTKKVQEYKDSLKTKAEQLLITGFPEKIVKLNELLETPDFRNRKLTDVHQDLNVPIPHPIVLNHSEDGPITKKIKVDNSVDETSGTKVMILPNGPVPCNKPLCELIHVVKPYIRQLLEDSNLLKMWISFLIPKIEDGNNFGVSIQEDTLAEIQSVESEAAAFFDQISRYFISRGKIVSKVAKYPHIIDYRRAIEELDEKEYVSLWLVMCEVRNRYCSLHDLVIKNLEKIKKPRSSNAQSLY